MCEYQKYKDNGLHICEPLNKLCTCCILGNWNQYKECQHIENTQGYTPIRKKVQ